jgi:hypothetical protein
MKTLKELNKLIGSKEQAVLAIILIIFILGDISAPAPLANMIDSVTGNIIVGILALSVFVNGHPLLGMLALVASYMLVKRSGHMPGFRKSIERESTENSKVMDFSKYNDYPVSLEEEIVDQMAPLVKHKPAPNSNYQPVLSKLHLAAPIDYTGVI